MSLESCGCVLLGTHSLGFKAARMTSQKWSIVALCFVPVTLVLFWGPPRSSAKAITPPSLPCHSPIQRRSQAKRGGRVGELTWPGGLTGRRYREGCSGQACTCWEPLQLEGAFLTLESLAELLAGGPGAASLCRLPMNRPYFSILIGFTHWAGYLSSLWVKGGQTGIKWRRIWMVKMKMKSEISPLVSNSNLISTLCSVQEISL